MWPALSRGARGGRGPARQALTHGSERRCLAAVQAKAAWEPGRPLLLLLHGASHVPHACVQPPCGRGLMPLAAAQRSAGTHADGAPGGQTAEATPSHCSHQLTAMQHSPGHRTQAQRGGGEDKHTDMHIGRPGQDAAAVAARLGVVEKSCPCCMLMMRL